MLLRGGLPNIPPVRGALPGISPLVPVRGGVPKIPPRHCCLRVMTLAFFGPYFAADVSADDLTALLQPVSNNHPLRRGALRASVREMATDVANVNVAG